MHQIKGENCFIPEYASIFNAHVKSDLIYFCKIQFL